MIILAMQTNSGSIWSVESERMESPYKGTREPEISSSVCDRFVQVYTLLTIDKEAKSKIGIEDSFLKFSWEILLKRQAAAGQFKIIFYLKWSTKHKCSGMAK